MKNVAPLKNACKSFEEDLVLYYYGDNGEADRQRVEEHLSKCLGCRSFVDDLRRLLPQMAHSEARPQSFWDNYYRETIAKLAAYDERKYWWGNLFAPVRMWLVPAFGTAAVAVLAIGLVIGKGNLSSYIDRSPANIPQEILADSDQLEFFKSLDMLESLPHLEEQEGKTIERNSKRSRLPGIEQGVA